MRAASFWLVAWAWLATAASAEAPAPARAHTAGPPVEPRLARLAVLAFRPKPETLQRWSPLVEYLDWSVPGHRFALDVYTYPELEAAVAEGRVEFVLTQPSHYILLTYRNGLSSPLATLVEKEDGHALPRFGGVIFARAERDDLRELKDLRGKTLAASSVNSLGSYQMQALELARVGVWLPGDARVLETGQPQDKAVHEVLAGRADAGFVRTGVLEAMTREGRLEPTRIKVINARGEAGFPFQLSTRLYPEWAFAAMPEVDQELARKVAAALLALPHDGPLARLMRIQGFTIPGDYRPVDDLLRELRLPPFDAAPAFTLRDVWLRFQGGIAVGAVTGSVLLALIALGLLRANFRLTREIHERQRAEAELRKLSLAVEQSPESILITDLAGAIEYVNESFVRNTGHSRAEALGRKPSLVSSGKTPPETYRAMWRTLRDGQVWRGEFINRRKDGSEYVDAAIIAPVREADGRIGHYLAIQQDVTAQKRADAEINRLAHYDALTGLPNRALLLDRLGIVLALSHRQPRQDALILFNLDRFKTLNDARGLERGDQLLRAVGERLADLLRDGDTLARLGGDEFAILLQASDPRRDSAGRRALRVAEKVHAALREPFDLDGEQTAITASLGVTLCPDDANDTAQEVLRRADTALHRAKEAGGNQTAFFDTGMGELARQRFLVERDLRRGLAAGELRLYLQTQVDADGATLGAEVLLRWQHPERGLLPPGVFLPVAEESDLIVDIDAWVLTEACRLLAARAAADRPLRLSVNVSPRHFRRASFVPWLRELIASSGADAGHLTLEVTEGLMIDDIDNVAAKMTALSALGIHFSVDDFGTGYSSLAYLKRLPIDELKIDKTFIQDAPTSPGDAALVEAILAVARSLHLHVVAEGVETPEQARFLTSRARVAHQGYLYGRPEPVEAWLARH
jgi:diguanylate cyclase (GGDEF)-like protein/PAS domain S-box-containing protein